MPSALQTARADPAGRPVANRNWLWILLLWFGFYASFALFFPPLLDDADSVHAEVAREMLLRHDYVTLYANGIRYLEKAPLLYWSMAASMKLAVLAGARSPRALAAAARLPVAFDVLGLALVVEMLGRLLFRSARAGLYAALITLSSFGIFLFSRITIPDAGVCLWVALAMLHFWQTEAASTPPAPDAPPEPRTPTAPHTPAAARACFGFAIACALNVLTKGLIGVVFPVLIVLVYLLLSRGLRGALARIRQLRPVTSLLVFLALAAPWHILAGLANPTQGHPAPFHFAWNASGLAGHWLVPLPTDGNVRGWSWFYFMNEHLLRYLNLRVPHDYDTAPLWLFWGLCLVWLMPWSAFIFNATWPPISQYIAALRVRLAAPAHVRALYSPDMRSARLLLIVWAGFVLLFFTLSTRQEYYVLPALPALALLIAGWLDRDASGEAESQVGRRAAYRCTAVLLAFGTAFLLASLYFLIHTRAPAPGADLAQLLAQNPAEYALSMGHFLDLNAQALGLFRLPLGIAALSLFLGPLGALLLRRAGRTGRDHAANLALAAGAFGFLLAAHLGLQTFAPVLTSAQLAQAIAPQVHAQDLVAIHGEYESGSSLGFYLQRSDIHIVDGRSSNLWYGSFFPDAPAIFETPESIARQWTGPRRIFLWQSLTDPPAQLPTLSGPVFVLVRSGGKEIVSNQPGP